MSVKRAFTLIELLVVVAILALLISILLPSLRAARERGWRAVCMSNLRQLTIALKQYGDDMKERCFPYDWDHLYLKALRPYHLNIDKLRYCPYAITRGGVAGQLVRGTADAGWQLFNEDGSYTFNSYLYSPGRPGVDPQSGYTNVPFPQAWWQTLAPPDSSASIPVFGDGNWVDAWPTHGDTVPPDLTTGWDVQVEGPPYHMGRFCLARHDRAINVAFIDGHAAWTPLRMLWNLRWSRAFELQGARSGS